MPDEVTKKALYIFIDESGNFDFSAKGTKYFALTAITTIAPLEARENLLRKVYDLKYEGWKEGRGDYYFHATEDKQEVRNWVFEAIKQLDDIEIDVILAQKNKANPSLYIEYEGKQNPQGGISFKTIHSEEKFYDKLSQMLLRYICNRHHENEEIEKIVIVLGSIFTEAKRGYVIKSLKQFFKANFQKPFFIYFHNTASDINCQIADYCGWAAYVKAERNEERPMQEIQSKVKSCFDVFARGTHTYYPYS